MLMQVHKTIARKPMLYPPWRPNGSERRRFLARLRDDIEILRAIGVGHSDIAEALGIEEYDVWAFAPKHRVKVLRRKLPRRVLNALLHGRKAHVGGRSVAKRSQHVAEIAASYTRAELLEEPGIGMVALTEIQLWLEERGLALKPDDDAAPAVAAPPCAPIVD